MAISHGSNDAQKVIGIIKTMGVGSAKRLTAVRWGTAGSMAVAWILTIPCSAFMAGLAWWLGRHLF
mgnify:CR=1 FL=1